MILEEDLEELYEVLKRVHEPKGYYLNPVHEILAH
jgi:hypothetical protein